MKYLLLAFIMSSAFASEKEGENYCESYLNQKYRTQREISDLTREMIRQHPGHAEETGPTIKHSADCEGDTPSDLETLQRRREYLENKIKSLNAEISRYCPRTYPE